jgi:hypothetical protein
LSSNSKVNFPCQKSFSHFGIISQKKKVFSIQGVISSHLIISL